MSPLRGVIHDFILISYTLYRLRGGTDAQMPSRVLSVCWDVNLTNNPRRVLWAQKTLTGGTTGDSSIHKKNWHSFA